MRRAMGQTRVCLDNATVGGQLGTARVNGLFNLGREWWYDRRPMAVMEKMECQP